MAHPVSTGMFKMHRPMAKHFGRNHSRFTTPWAIAGMVAAFTGGTVVGMLGHKKAMMSAEGEGMSYRPRWMSKHHHHGFGSPACRTEHEPVAPGATDEPMGMRNEGE